MLIKFCYFSIILMVLTVNAANGLIIVLQV